MAILILSPPDDEHARHIGRSLETRGETVRLLNSADFPANLQVSYDPVAERGRFRFPDGTSVEFADVTAVYWRSYGGGSLPRAEQADVLQDDARGLFESLLVRLRTRWVNGWEGFQLHQTKPAALAMVAELGVPVPATMLTNDPEGLIEFIDRHTRCIFKPVQGGARTRRLELRHLADENLENLRYSPVTLQEEIAGTDVRVFVAGDRVLACEVQSGELDFRDDPNPAVMPLKLPDGIVDRSVRIARTLHLLWTGIDYRRTPDGRYVFLEANPSPAFLEYERRSGLPLTEALTDLLREA